MSAVAQYTPGLFSMIRRPLVRQRLTRIMTRVCEAGYMPNVLLTRRPSQGNSVKYTFMVYN